jgi:hypothetical protein
LGNLTKNREHPCGDEGKDCRTSPKFSLFSTYYQSVLRTLSVCVPLSVAKSRLNRFKYKYPSCTIEQEHKQNRPKAVIDRPHPGRSSRLGEKVILMGWKHEDSVSM